MKLIAIKMIFLFHVFQLFDHIAECLEHYLQQLGLSNRTLPLGFTFSFPCMQKGLTSAFLTQWTKGFNCSGVIGKDVVQLLREAVKRRNVIISFIVLCLYSSVKELLKKLFWLSLYFLKQV